MPLKILCVTREPYLVGPIKVPSGLPIVWQQRCSYDLVRITNCNSCSEFYVLLLWKQTIKFSSVQFKRVVAVAATVTQAGPPGIPVLKVKIPGPLFEKSRKFPLRIKDLFTSKHVQLLT